jgi:hypothetical protein
MGGHGDFKSSLSSGFQKIEIVDGTAVKLAEALLS